MPYAVVCISSTDGAGGREVGHAVADALGYRLVDEAIVLRAARDAGVEPHVAMDAERRRTLLARLVEGLSSSGPGVSSAAGFVPIGIEYIGTEPSGELRDLIRTAVEETAAEGDVVIVAHAASVALAGRADTLRVLVTAPSGTRVRRLASEGGLDEREAKRLVEESDAGRAAYLKRFYGVSEERPTHYDLVVSTDRLSADDAARLVVAAATS
jgi:cytidylate kinase